MIYLDDTANTPVDPAVLAAFCAAETRYFGNPNADHPAGQAARAALARTTEAIARLLGVLPGEIIYTSGATEANDLAVKGLAQAAAPAGRHILTTALSHASVRGAQASFSIVATMPATTPFKSPTMGTCASRILPISAGSMSM